jgi:Family of unknown function (DUF6428)
MPDDLKPMAAIDATDMTLGAFLAMLDATPDLPLIFDYDGRPIQPGYHVTEVKAGQFAALDCGATPESWSEIFVQLWDVNEGSRTHMVAATFAKIMRKVSDHVGLDMTSRLTFEVSDGVAPMQLYRVAHPALTDQNISAPLLPRAASCKPRDRWLDQSRNTACCG